METEVDNVNTLKSNISKVQNEIKLNPNNYDSHVELISLLSKLYFLFKSDEGKLEEDAEEKNICEQTTLSFKKLRNSRQNMSTIYPLTIELWTKWIEDEINAPPCLKSHEVIEEVFSKAIVDYLSVDIWVMYAEYLISRFEDSSTDVTVDFIRDVFEKAVTNCGLHYEEGCKIWHCYQEFELKLLSEAEKQAQENSNEENIKRFKTNLMNLVKLFKREMSLPLGAHCELLILFKRTIEPHLEIFKSISSETAPLINMDEIKKIHEKTANYIESNSIDVNEKNLEESQHLFEAYQSYIMHELDAGVNDPARIQCLFERAIVHHCLKSSLWLDYIDFLNNVIKLPDLVIAACNRALRNITWDSRIYIKYALILEDMSHDIDGIRETYEMGLEKYSSNGFNYCSIFISYLSFEKRICKNEESILKKKPRVYYLIQRALNQLDVLEDADKCIVEFVLFWVDVERFWFNNEEKINDIWKYMTSKYKTLWYQALTYARTVGSKDLVNDIFDITLLQFPNEVESFYQSWLNYENIFGTVDSLNHLTKRIKLHLPSHIQARKTKESQSMLSKIEHRNKFLKSWLRNVEEKLFSLKKTRSSNSESSLKQPRHAQKSAALKHTKNVHNDSDRGVNKIFLGVDIEKSKKSDGKRKHDEISGNDTAIIGPVLPPGFLASNNDDEESDDSDENDNSHVEEEDDDVPLSKKQKFVEDISESNKSSESETYSEDNTVFVSNLHPATKVADLKAIFSKAGNVQKVDLRKQKGGKIFAFITYNNREELQKAFELEHTPLFNRPLYVSEFTKHKENAVAGASLYSRSQEKNKLFVSNLAKTTTQIDLEKLFNQYGDMVSLRLINKKGSSKPFAYVEYGTEEAAIRYRKAINNTVVRGHAIIVEFSNPSVANQGRQRTLTNSLHPVKRKLNDVDASVPAKMSHTETSSDSAFIKPKPVSFGLIPSQARNRNQQILNKQQSTKKGPAVRIDFVPTTNNGQSNSDEGKHEPVAGDKDKSSAAAVSSARKSNDEFRKMFFKS